MYISDTSERWDISVSSVARSFILSCLYSLTISPDNEIRQKRSKTTAKAMSQVIGESSTQEAIKKDLSEVDRLEAMMEDRYKGLPDEDKRGKIISRDDWDWARTHRNYACPCGSGKKYKKCHGA